MGLTFNVGASSYCLKKDEDEDKDIYKVYWYASKDNIISSVSSIFTLIDYYNSSSLRCNGVPFFYIDKKTITPSKNTISPFAEKLAGDKKLNIQDKQKLLTKIMVPKGFLNE